MSNDVLLSAVYVDSRYRLTLGEDQFPRGKQVLSSIAMRMHQFSGQQNDASQESVNFINAKALLSTADTVVFSSSDDELDYERHLDSSQTPTSGSKSFFQRLKPTKQLSS